MSRQLAALPMTKRQNRTSAIITASSANLSSSTNLSASAVNLAEFTTAAAAIAVSSATAGGSQRRRRALRRSRYDRTEPVS
ncbi:hypothetical protein Tdes44962_MAKER07936 [Teratosphaeria destructans]|uniref:Uncharacterized protein n=1 Tax=Teratosphaeria destructans TaxID=418781 RepID=A0A9W7SXS5_9PEZI|nr:hypothetical protein Tdes44962_MAKER07936 [Teratosphaeria destructans]